MPTADTRLVFVLGKELHGNRQAVIVEAGDEYSLDQAAAVAYTNATAAFPYSV